MDEVWVVGVITDWTGISAQLLAKAKSVDIKAVKQIWCFLLNVSMLTQVPPELKDKRVALQIFKARMLQVGDRAKLLKNGFIKSSGECNWLLGANECTSKAES